MSPLPSYFAGIDDPRGHSHAQRHQLLDILMIAWCAMRSGVETFVDRESYGREKHSWLQERLGLSLKHGLPVTTHWGECFTRGRVFHTGASVCAP